MGQLPNVGSTLKRLLPFSAVLSVLLRAQFLAVVPPNRSRIAGDGSLRGLGAA
jgi:hypothetical protein